MESSLRHLVYALCVRVEGTDGMLTEVKIRLPGRLISTGQGILSLPIGLVDRSLLHDYRVRCRVENLPDSGEYRHYGEFTNAGQLSLTLPGNLSGVASAILDVNHRQGGGRYNGAFRIQIAYHSESSLNVRVEGHSGTGANYQPVEVHGQEPKEIEVVGNDVVVTVPLESDVSVDAIRLRTLAELEECLMLPEEGNGVHRVFQLCVGQRLAVGRCYVSQIGREAKARLDQEGMQRVDWVSSWDDPLLNRLSLVMNHHNSNLELKNVSDYSSRKRPKAFMVEHRGDVLAFETEKALKLCVDNQSVVRVTVGESSRARTLLRLNYEDIPVGDFAVPVYRSEGMSFCLPPEGGSGSILLHFLGLWLPLELEDLEEMLNLAADPLSISFPGDDFSLWLRGNPKTKEIMVSSNVNLKNCLG